MLMRCIKSVYKLKIGKTLVCLAILALLLAFSPFVTTSLAAPGSGGPNTGLPDHLILSWTEDPLTAQTISWRTGIDASQDRLQYMPAAEFSGSFAGAQEVTGERNNLYEGHYRFEATLRGLAPGTEYVYRVGRDGAWSEPATFTTATVDGRFSFLYMGDIQEGYEFWGEMLEQVAAENPELKFALIGGDLVDRGSSITEWQEFFAAAWPVFKELPLMPAVGNHDDTELFRNSFALPRNGPQGYEDTIYSFDYGNCHITVLNSNCMGVPGTGDYERVAGWLQDDLVQSQQRWKFLVFHHPPYSVVHDWRADVLQEHWVPLFEQSGVDMVFVGHQHVYMRTKPLRDGVIEPDGEGVVYIMGNAGTKYYGPGPAYDYIAEQIAWVSSYQVIDIDGNTLTMTSRDAEGNVIDSYLLVKDIPVTGIIIPEGDQVLKIGETFQFTAEVQPGGATNKGVTWESSDETIAAVSESGLVTAVAEGEATITAIADDGGFSDSVVVTVKEEVIDDPRAQLQKAISEALALEAGDYTLATWRALERSLHVAQTILNLEHAALASVGQALARLTFAGEQLVEKPDKTSLEAAIDAALDLDSQDYTPRSWRRMSQALSFAISVYENENAAQSAVDKALSRLVAALDGLVER